MIEAEAAGFKKFGNADVNLPVEENVRPDIALEVGQLTESIEVTAQAALVDARSPEPSATIDDRRVADLPRRGRKVFSLAATVPGAPGVAAPGNTDVGAPRAGPRMNANGGRSNLNYNRFNGTYFNKPATSPASSTYGRIPGSAAGRLIQFGLKYLWQRRRLKPAAS